MSEQRYGIQISSIECWTCGGVVDNDALYCVNCKEDSTIPAIKLGLAWAESSGQVALCAWCNTDMVDEVCFNSKDICIDCCVKAGDPCGHHLCSEKCPCGRFVKEEQTKGVFSQFGKPKAEHTSSPCWGCEYKFREGDSFPLDSVCEKCCVGIGDPCGHTQGVTKADIVASEMTQCGICRLWTTSEIEICASCFDADWEQAHRLNEWTLPEDEGLLVRVLRKLPDAKQSTLIGVLAMLHKSS